MHTLYLRLPHTPASPTHRHLTLHTPLVQDKKNEYMQQMQEFDRCRPPAIYVVPEKLRHVETPFKLMCDSQPCLLTQTGDFVSCIVAGLEQGFRIGFHHEGTVL